MALEEIAFWAVTDVKTNTPIAMFQQAFADLIWVQTWIANNCPNANITEYTIQIKR